MMMICSRAFILFWLIFVIETLLSKAAVKDNTVTAPPQVQCNEEGLVFEIVTKRPFTGQIYVRNEYNKPECTANFNAVHMPFGSMAIRFSQCGMRRQRTLKPRGLAYTVTLMVKFHEIFVTKSDKAFQVRCFYRETEAHVTSRLGVSPLTTSQVASDFPAPDCIYEIRHADLDGPEAGFVRVGDQVVHVFRCDHADVYGMLVKNCYVDDGKENKELVIGDNGCPVDPDIIHTPFYTVNRLESHAIAEATVFKWPDQPAVYFSCQISLCMRDEGECDGITPPICGRKKFRRFYRDINDRNQRDEWNKTNSGGRTMELDLEVRKLIVLDLDDLLAARQSKNNEKASKAVADEHDGHSIAESLEKARLFWAKTSKPEKPLVNITSLPPQTTTITPTTLPQTQKRTTISTTVTEIPLISTTLPMKVDIPSSIPKVRRTSKPSFGYPMVQNFPQPTDIPFWQLLNLRPRNFEKAEEDTSTKKCYGSELLAGFTFLVTIVSLALIAGSCKLCYPFIKRQIIELTGVEQKSSKQGSITHDENWYNNLPPSLGSNNTYDTATGSDDKNFMAWRKAYGNFGEPI